MSTNSFNLIHLNFDFVVFTFILLIEKIKTTIYYTDYLYYLYNSG